MGFGDFLWSIALKKGAVQFATALIALAGVDTFSGMDMGNVEKVVIALVVGLLNVARNWLKQHGQKWL